MWFYEKALQFPVRVSKCDVRMAKFLFEAYGGPNGPLSQALCYLNQRYTMPPQVIAILNDIGTEELAHLEMVATMIYKLTKDATVEQLVEAGLGGYYAEHGRDLFYQNAQGVRWTASYIQAVGDPFANLNEDIALEERGRAMYQNLIDLTDDVDLQDALKFLRERDIVHSLRFREAVEILKGEEFETGQE